MEMSKIGAAGLGLLVLLSQPSLEAQRGTIVPNPQTRQAQQDIGFLRLYDEVKTLETKLANEPPEAENRVYTKTFIVDGKPQEEQVHAGPPDISDVILQEKQKETVKLASRYGIPFDPDETGIFTWGNNL